MKKQPNSTHADKPLFPVRINKYLAWKQFATRRGADELIEKKHVFINGRHAILGDKVEETDRVEVLHNKKAKPLVYFAYNKPMGIVTHSPQGTEKDIRYAVRLKEVFPVGRLDKDSHGLIILTNDGRITDKLLNPDYAHEKEYVVTTKLKLRQNFKEKMESGVDIEEYRTKPCKVRMINDFTFGITLTEGKKHQIRRMCVALFNEVKDINRIRVMNIALGTLPVGAHRKITDNELEVFLKNLGF
jgi:23S rRNA pseudouridine2604 synthase